MKDALSRLAHYRKAAMAALTAAAPVVVTVSADGAVTGSEWLMVLGAAVAAAAGTWAVPNKPKPTE